MWPIEINGNLDGPGGLKNYGLFQKTILEVYSYFAKKIMSQYPDGPELYIDNATDNSGYTPVTTPIFCKYVIIKLHIVSTDPASKIAFQFAHELTHYVYYTKYGLNKKKADDSEETVCTAASLIYLHDVMPENFASYNEYIKKQGNVGYRNGAVFAEQIEYDFMKLIERI